jgi:phage terminase large subunit-like protein
MTRLSAAKRSTLLASTVRCATSNGRARLSAAMSRLPLLPVSSAGRRSAWWGGQVDYLADIHGETFTVEDYLGRIEDEWPGLLGTTRGRKILSRLDPLLFAILYFPHHLQSGSDHQGPITLSRFHIEACQLARSWADGKRHRDAVIAPRGSGKSTWFFLILTTWALAHRHRTFVAAFADSASQAQQHLISFKQELDNNDLIRMDFSGLVEGAKRVSGASVADRKDLYVSRNQQVFQAKGIDSSTLGAKVGNQRPDLILFDDVEPDESNYSDYQKVQRLSTIINAVFPMNLNAAVVFSGTVVMAGSIMHDLVRTVTEEQEAEDESWPDWVYEEGISVHYYPALSWDGDGNAISIWPQMWSTEWMLSGEPIPVYRTASFQLNFQNNPRGREDGWWTEELFIHESLGEDATRWILQIDPAVTDKKLSDYTGLVVGGFAPARRNRPARLEVAYADRVKLVGEAFRRRILKILEWYPQIRAIRIESNIGGEMWRQTLRNMPVPIYVARSTATKESRIARALDWYQRPGKRVVHSGVTHKLENDLIAFPSIKHDDLVDCLALMVLFFMEPERKQRVGVRTNSYIG